MTNSNYHGLNHREEEGGMIVYRQSRITPRKKGEFVAVWLRDTENKTRPYDHRDEFDFFVIANEENDAYFRIPRDILIQEGVVGSEISKGKRGFRLYAPGLILDSVQSKKTQSWQAQYYHDTAYIIK